MKREAVIDRKGKRRELAVRDGVREFYDGEIMTAARMNQILGLVWKAKRLLWAGIVLTVISIALAVARRLL